MWSPRRSRCVPKAWLNLYSCFNLEPWDILGELPASVGLRSRSRFPPRPLEGLEVFGFAPALSISLRVLRVSGCVFEPRIFLTFLTAEAW